MAYEYADVVVSITNKNVDGMFTYKVPEGLREKIQPGMRVLVPFKNVKACEGYVARVTNDAPDFPPEKLRQITSLPDDYPFITGEMLELAAFMHKKYFTSLAQCLKCVVPAGVAGKKDLSRRVRHAALAPGVVLPLAALPGGLTQTQRAVVDFLAENGSTPISEIKAQLNISDAPIKTLVKKALIFTEDVEVRRDTVSVGATRVTPPELNAAQSRAVNRITDKIATGDNKPVLLHGVTGSGKTEVYMRVIEAVLAAGKDAVMLVPEISLTPQVVGIFAARFGNKITVTHSRLSDGERYDQWRKVLHGDVSIIIGPRSAVFAPFKRLGVIIIDEEHENTYKSDLSPKYSTRDVALERGRLTGAQVILGSATPSIETYYDAQNGSLELIELPERINKMMPSVSVVDMRNELACGNRSIFSEPLQDAMRRTIANGKQMILFMNRRGHSTFVSCRRCGNVLKCDSCSVNYVYHIYENKLMCHYCGKKTETPENCPVCGSKFIKYFGLGTQKIEEEAARLLPGVATIRMDFDTTSGKHNHERLLGAFRDKRAQVLVGTQMIAKGLDFPDVSLVGIIAADISLNNGDFRSGETTYQLLSQVSGRAGRAGTQGEVYIQTYNPEHYAIRFAREHNYEQFYNHEITVRRQMQYPPFTHVFSVLFTSPDEKRIIVLLFKLLKIMQHYNRNNLFEMLGPTPAIIFKIKKQFRWKLLIKCAEEERLKNFCLYCMDKLEKEEALTDIGVNLTMDPAVIL